MNDNNDEPWSNGKGKEEADEMHPVLPEVDAIHRMLMGESDEGQPQPKRASPDPREQEEARAQEARAAILKYLDMAEKAQKEAAELEANAPGPDGAHSTSVGPAPCKLRHWYEGREVDYVTRYGGKHILGFDAVDNPLLVARDFVAKKRLNPTSTDNTALIGQIAEQIRETIQKDEPENLDLNHLIDQGSAANPYADSPNDLPTILRPNGENGGIKAVYNHSTKQVDVFHYATDSGVAERELKNEASKAQETAKRKETLRREEEIRTKEEIKEKIARMRQEKNQESNNSNLVTGTGLLTGQRTMHSARMATLNSVISKGSSGGTAFHQNGEIKTAKIVPKSKEEWDNGYAVELYKKYGREDFLRLMREAEFSAEEEKLVLSKMELLLVYEQMTRLGQREGEPDLENDSIQKSQKPLFLGQGHSLTQIEKKDEENGENSAEIDIAEISIDESLPVTQVRISIPGRAPVTTQFNLIHTVQDIRRFVNRNHPQIQPFHLQTLRPPRRLLPDETIEQAGLKMSSVTIILFK